uniref:Uncharacterized protein n=1 Tax=Vespula pensylvanica TaxID=30213 RepID=A0A834K0F3_VESPE|nr:hypothetical protein H0235_016433 [Vespula pensylvanica]
MLLSQCAKEKEDNGGRVSRVCNRSKGYRVERNSASEPGPHWRYVAGPPDPFLYFRNPRQHDHPGYPP